MRRENRSLDKAEEFWDKVAGRYDEAEERFDPVHTKIVEWTRPYLNRDDIVLDLGCATGSKALMLKENVKQIHGIDISPKMIEIAEKRRVEASVENIRFTRTTLFDERLQKESFHVVLAFAILHSLENEGPVIQRIAELLKPGGLFISATPCFREKADFASRLQILSFTLMSKAGRSPIPFNRYTFKGLENRIAGGNFTIVKTEKLFQRMSSFYVVAEKR